MTKDYHNRNPEKRKEWAKKSHTKSKNTIRSFIIEFKETNACADCGQFYPYYVMDFDHLRDKTLSVSRMYHTSMEKILEEMAKCDLVCSNCHRIRSYRRYEEKYREGE